jgi:glycosidase
MAMFLATLSGTLSLYQGQEIGMTNFSPNWVPDKIRDVEASNYWNKMNKDYPNHKEMLQRAKVAISNFGRDNARAPVHWSGSKPNAGFTSGEPWIPVNENYTDINVEAVLKNEEGVLRMWKNMIKMRREHEDSFVYGRFEILDMDNKELFMYNKKGEKEEVFVVLYFTSLKQEITIPEALKGNKMDTLAATSKDKDEKLGPWDRRVYSLNWGDDMNVRN